MRRWCLTLSHPNRDFGLSQSWRPVKQARHNRNDSSERSMWLANPMCSGLFRCCGVFVHCRRAEAGRDSTCRCKRADPSDSRPWREASHSCALVVRHLGLCLRALIALTNACCYPGRHRSAALIAGSTKTTVALTLTSTTSVTATLLRVAVCGLRKDATARFVSRLDKRCAVA